MFNCNDALRSGAVILSGKQAAGYLREVKRMEVVCFKGKRGVWKKKITHKSLVVFMQW